MSFVDNQKIVGWAFFIVGVLMVISALLSLVDAVGMEGGIGENIGYAIAALGAIISAVLYFLYGNKVRTGVISGKMNILCNFVKIVGVTTVIGGIFSAIGGIISSIPFWGSILVIILGFIILWIASKMDDGKETTMDKIIWIILVVVFILCFIGSLLSIGGGIISIISAICEVVIYLFMLLYMFDNDVKKQMGM